MHLKTPHMLDRYPAELIDVWHGRTGGRFTLRPVLPQDDAPLGELIRRLSPAARRARFHASIAALPDATLQAMTRVDYRRRLGIVVTTREHDREVIVGDARYEVDDDGHAAEFAIVVDDLWRRSGIGAHAMDALCRAAARAGVRWLHGTVLAGNAPMLALMRRCGFCCTPSGDDEALVHVERRLESGRAAALPRLAAPWSAMRRLQAWMGRAEAA